MSIRSLINFGEVLDTSVGVNIHIGDEDALNVSYCILKKRKNSILIVQYEAGLSSLEAVRERLVQYAPGGASIHLNIEGKGVLTKQYTKEEAVKSKNELIKKLFPVVKAEDFYIQQYEGEANNFVSVIRHKSVQIGEALREKFSVISISFGVFVIDQMLALIDNNELSIPGYHIKALHGKFADFVSSSNIVGQPSVKIGDQPVPANILLAYSSALYLFLPMREVVLAEIPWVKASENSYRVKRKFYTYGRIALISLLAILFINTLIYLWLQKEVQEIETQERLVSGRSIKQNEHQKRASEIMGEYDNLGWERNIMPIYYADQLAQTVHSDIRMTLLEIGVLDNTLVRKEKRLLFQQELIKIEGVADNATALHQWLVKIENLPWVNEVYDQKYVYDAKQAKGVFHFYLKVK